MLDGINYWDELKDSPSHAEACFAIFANVLELDEHGMPTDEKYAERRAAIWLQVLHGGRFHTARPTWRNECQLL